MKEFWFAGNHGDVGGWLDRKEGDNPSRLLSDIPLAWIIQEILDLPEKENRLAFKDTTIPRPSYILLKVEPEIYM